jgi:hypothetical protein
MRPSEPMLATMLADCRSVNRTGLAQANGDSNAQPDARPPTKANAGNNGRNTTRAEVSTSPSRPSSTAASTFSRSSCRIAGGFGENWRRARSSPRQSPVGRNTKSTAPPDRGMNTATRHPIAAANATIATAASGIGTSAQCQRISATVRNAPMTDAPIPDTTARRRRKWTGTTRA